MAEERTAPTITLFEQQRRAHCKGQHGSDDTVTVTVQKVQVVPKDSNIRLEQKHEIYIVEIENNGAQPGLWREELTKEQVPIALRMIRAGAFPKYVEFPKEWEL
jgi:hypothetical protein